MEKVTEPGIQMMNYLGREIFESSFSDVSSSERIHTIPDLLFLNFLHLLSSPLRFSLFSFSLKSLFFSDSQLLALTVGFLFVPTFLRKTIINKVKKEFSYEAGQLQSNVENRMNIKWLKMGLSYILEHS